MLPPEPRRAQLLRDAAAGLGLPLDDRASDRLLRFLELLQRWNATYNLTAVRDPDAMITQHLADCMAVARPLERHLAGGAARLLDVGSGAGLPGVVLAVLCPRLTVTCVEPVGKKAAFVRQVAGELALANLSIEHGRAESGTGRFDVVTSRAFARLADFTSLTHTRIEPSGAWMAMKGRQPDDEIAELSRDVEVFHVEQLTVPGLNAERCLVWMRPSATS